MWIPQVDVKEVRGIAETRLFLYLTWHRDRCLKDLATYEALKAEYDRTWPEHCQTCAGWGFFVEYQRHDPYGSEAIIEPCECVLEDVCPRCAYQNPERWGEGESGPCQECGFALGYGGSSGSEGLPHPPECNCGEFDGAPDGLTLELDTLESLRDAQRLAAEGEEAARAKNLVAVEEGGLTVALRYALHRGFEQARKESHD